MKLGLLADIHESNEHLRVALDQFRDEDVDQVVVPGDLFELGERIEEMCRRLGEVGAVGVWGNHDFGLCSDLDERTQEKCPDSVVDYMSSLRPRLHRWLMATPGVILGWAGEKPIRLDSDSRYLIVVAAVCDGKSSIFDTDTLELFPFG